MSQQPTPDFDQLIDQWRQRWKSGGSKQFTGGLSLVLGGVFFLLLLLVTFSTFFINREYETVIITRFGKPVQTKETAGIGVKIPFMDQVNRIDMRARAWDGESADMTTRDKLYIKVNSFARWKVSNPRKFLESVSNDERRALSRIDGILDSETRTQVGANRLVEVIRTTKGREPFFPEDMEEQERSVFEPIINGRTVLEERISTSAKEKLEDIGVELLEFYLKRVNYNEEVQRNVEERMKSERMRIASRFRAEGDEQASIIDGTKERELLRIESDAFRRAEEIRGQAEQEAYQIYNEAYAATPQHREFYSFLKRMDSYEQSLTGSVFFLQTDNPYLSGLKGNLSALNTNTPSPSSKKIDEEIDEEEVIVEPLEPDENQALIQQDYAKLVLNVDKDGVITIDNEELSKDELLKRLKRVVQLYPNSPVIIRTHADTEMIYTQNAARLCAEAGISSITFASKR